MWRRRRVPLEDFSRDFATHLRAELRAVRIDGAQPIGQRFI
jgi:hypothetical protein